jgi:hypothetical protein
VRFERSVPFIRLAVFSHISRAECTIAARFQRFRRGDKIAGVGTTRIAQEKRSAGAWSKGGPIKTSVLRVAPIALLTPFLVVTLACERASRSPDALQRGRAQEQGSVHEPNYC